LHRATSSSFGILTEHGISELAGNVVRPASADPTVRLWSRYTFNEYTFNHSHGVQPGAHGISHGSGVYGVYDSSAGYYSGNRPKLVQDDGPGRPAGGWYEYGFIPVPQSPKVQMLLGQAFAELPVAAQNETDHYCGLDPWAYFHSVSC